MMFAHAFYDTLNLKKFRFERKFLVSDVFFEEVEDIVLSNTGFFSEIYFERIVNNIYFDNEDMTHYHDNVSGNNRRIKVRIRWYGETFGEVESPVLELKVKTAEMGSKLSFPLVPFAVGKHLSTEDLLDVFKRSDLPPYLMEYLLSLKMTLLNRYLRRYYMSSDKKFRITLDRGMEYFNVSGFFESAIHQDYFILELKYDDLHDGQAHVIADQFPCRLSKSSKYVTGVECFL